MTSAGNLNDSGYTKTDIVEVDVQVSLMFYTDDVFIDYTLRGATNTDKSFCQQASNILFDNAQQISFGSLMPFILVNNDMKEVLFAYKDGDGKNTVKKYELQGDSWKKVNESTKNGIKVK